MNKKYTNNDLLNAFKAMPRNVEYQSKLCVVSNVNLTDMTCTASPLDGSADYEDVMLSINQSKGFLLIPEDGSTIIVTEIDKTFAFVSMVADVDQVYLNGDSKGGLVNVVDAVSKLNAIENKINLILSYLAGLGATPPLTTPLVPTVRVDIENNTVQHGS